MSVLGKERVEGGKGWKESTSCAVVNSFLETAFGVEPRGEKRKGVFRLLQPSSSSTIPVSRSSAMVEPGIPTTYTTLKNNNPCISRSMLV
jgi:hypothetical protein